MQVQEAIGLSVGNGTGLVTRLHTGEFAGVMPSEVVKWVREVEDHA